MLPRAGAGLRGAIARFAELIAAKPTDDREQRDRELANLSPGAAALRDREVTTRRMDQYQEIRQERVNFPDSLYEIAWA